MALRPLKRQKRLPIPEVQQTEEPGERHSDRIESARASAQASGVSHEEGRHIVFPESKEKKPGRLTSKTDRGNAKKASKKKQNPKGILSFFNTITQSQNANPSQSDAEHQEESDVIEDERVDLYSAPAKGNEESQARATSINVRSSIKSYPESSNNLDVFGTKFAPRPSFAFRNDNAIGSTSFKESPCLSWSDAFPPESVNELALHPKKISSIRSWLQDAIDGAGDKVKYRKPSSNSNITDRRLESSRIERSCRMWQIGSYTDHCRFNACPPRRMGKPYRLRLWFRRIRFTRSAIRGISLQGFEVCSAGHDRPEYTSKQEFGTVQGV